MWMSCFRMISRQSEWGQDLYVELRLILCAYSLEFAWENTNWANSLCAKVSNRSVKTKFDLTAVCFWFGNEIVWNLWVTFVWEQNILAILTYEINHVSGHIPQLCFSALTITLTDHLLTLCSWTSACDFHRQTDQFGEHGGRYTQPPTVIMT